MQTVPVDTFVLNARIATTERPRAFAGAMAVSQGRIVVVGSAEDIRNFAPGAHVIDCGGGAPCWTAIPKRAA